MKQNATIEVPTPVKLSYKEREVKRFDTATEVANSEYDGPVYSPEWNGWYEGYFESMEAFTEECYNNAEPDENKQIYWPKWVFVATLGEPKRKDAAELAETLMNPDDYCVEDDFTPKGVSELQKALDAFYEANKGYGFYETNYKQKIKVPSLKELGFTDVTEQPD